MFGGHGARTPAIAALIACSIPLACFVGDEREAAEYESVREGLDQMAEGLGRTAEGLREAVSDFSEGTVERPINFREFYDLLPDEVGDFARTAREGSTEGAAGMDISRVEAKYGTESGARIDVEIVDIGAIGGPALFGMAAWMNITVDRETSDGWERTTEFRGQPAYEEFDRSGEDDRGRGELTYIVERRFLVQISGSRVTWDDIEAFADAIGTDELADMKDREG